MNDAQIVADETRQLNAQVARDRRRQRRVERTVHDYLRLCSPTALI